MTEDCDEEVVFENSPLFQYLQDLGLDGGSDFEACPTLSQEEEQNAGGDEGAWPQETPPPQTDGGIWRLVEAMRSFSPFHQCHINQQEQELDTVFRQYSVRCVLSQAVLLQEDVELIELLDPGLLSLGSAAPGCPHADQALPGPRYLAKPSVWDFSVLVGLLAVLLAVRCVCAGCLPAVLCVCMCVCVWHVCALWRTARLQCAVQSQAMQLEALLDNSRALTSLTRKALRLIQETEVISRGFTLVSGRGYSRAGIQRGQLLIGLRKATYQSLRSTFRASRLATCIMLKSFPLSSEIDNVTNYVSTVPIRELGLGLGAEPLSDEQLQELTNDYSLPALKILFQLWVGQSSEFFRRLTLLLSPGNERDSALSPSNQRDSPGLLMHRAVATVTGALGNTLASCLHDLQRSYDFHRYYETQQQGSERSGLTHTHTRQTCQELNTLHTNVRSLQLHLRTLLNEVIILEDELEKLMVARETVAMTCAGYRELHERLRMLQPHMQASAGCWDDTLIHVERMLHRVTNSTDTPDSPEDGAPRVPPPPPPPPPLPTLIQDQDPVPEEQELEAYVSDSDSEAEWGGASVSPWERERERQEGAESRRVLLELKSVLTLRTSNTERHKRQLLLFNNRAAVKATAVETSEPQGTSECPEPAEAAATASNHASHGPSEGAEEEEEKGEDMREGGSRLGSEEVMEFSCGLPEERGDPGGAEPPTGGAQLYQSDGLSDETRPLAHRVPALSVTDRLTELHGSAALSFSSALATQVAARSHTFAHLHETTFSSHAQTRLHETTLGDQEEGEEEEDD